MDIAERDRLSAKFAATDITNVELAQALAVLSVGMRTTLTFEQAKQVVQAWGGASGMTLRVVSNPTLRLTIPGRPPTPNARRNRYALASDNRAWRQTGYIVGLDARNKQGWLTPPLARLTLIFYVPDHRTRDQDNLFAAQKPVIDGLVKAGVILRDDHEHVRYVLPPVRIIAGLNATDYVIERIDGQEAMDLP